MAAAGKLSVCVAPGLQVPRQSQCRLVSATHLHGRGIGLEETPAHFWKPLFQLALDPVHVQHLRRERLFAIHLHLCRQHHVTAKLQGDQLRVPEGRDQSSG